MSLTNQSDNTSIVFLCPKAYPLFNKSVKEVFGGAEAALFLNAKMLKKEEAVKISFIVADYGQPAKETMHGVELIRSFCFKDSLPVKIIKFKKAMDQADAHIFVHSTLNLFSGFVSLYCKFKRKKVIYMLASDYEVDGRAKKDMGILAYFFASLAFKCSDHVVCQNAKQEELLCKMQVKNIRQLNYGVTIWHEPAQKDDYVLWVGRSVPSKGHNDFIELAEKRFDLRFVMVSAGKPGDPFHEKIVERVKCIKNLKFIDYAAFEDIADYYKKAKLFVSTSVMEGFPVSFLEAMSYGTPVVSLNIDPDNCLEANKAGFSCGGDKRKFEENIDRLLTDKELYEEMSLNASYYVRRNHDISVIAKKFFEIVTNV